MQFVIQAYMKHLGVKVKESRGSEPKPKLISLLPKIKVTPPKHFLFFPANTFPPKEVMYCFYLICCCPEQKTIRQEKDGSVEEKLKKPRFQIIRSHNKRPSRTDAQSGKPTLRIYTQIMYCMVCGIEVACRRMMLHKKNIIS